MHPFGKIAINVQRVHTMDDGQRKLDLRKKRRQNNNSKDNYDGNFSSIVSINALHGFHGNAPGMRHKELQVKAVTCNCPLHSAHHKSRWDTLSKRPEVL